VSHEKHGLKSLTHNPGLEKSQISSTKLQTIPKHQYSMTETRLVWYFEFRSLGFV